MSRQALSRQSAQTEELTTEIVDPRTDRHDVAGHREASPSRSTIWPVPPARWFAERPHGHVVGHAIGEPQRQSFAGRPHGHVVGHAIGEPQPQSFAGRPHGHVVGHGAGHAFGKSPPQPLPTTYRKAA